MFWIDVHLKLQEATVECMRVGMEDNPNYSLGWGGVAIDLGLWQFKWMKSFFKKVFIKYTVDS